MIASNLKELETVGVPPKETIFYPKLGGEVLRVAVDELVEFTVALPRPTGAYGYHWGKGDEVHAQIASARRGLLFLGQTISKDWECYRFLPTRPVDGPMDVYVQGGRMNDHPPEYRMVLTVRGLAADARLRKIQDLASSLDKVKREYAVGLVKTGQTTQPKTTRPATQPATGPAPRAAS
jgi:hypothetical protein